MLLLFGGSSEIGQEIIKQYTGGIISVSRKCANKNASSRGVIYKDFNIDDVLKEQSVLKEIFNDPTEIEYVVFGHRYRPSTGNYKLQDSIRTEIEAPLQLCRELTTTKTKLKGIIFLSSIASTLVADEQPIEYHICKSSIRQMARYLAIEMMPKNISVNIIELAYVKQTKKVIRNSKFYSTAEKVLHGGYVPEPKDIGNLIIGMIKLMENRLFTGQEINADRCLTMESQSSILERYRRTFEQDQ